MDHMLPRLETIAEAGGIDHEKVEEKKLNHNARTGFHSVPAISNSQIIELVIGLTQIQVNSSPTKEPSDTIAHNKKLKLEDIENPAAATDPESTLKTISLSDPPSENEIDMSYEQETKRNVRLQLLHTPEPEECKIETKELTPEQLTQKLQYELGQSQLRLRHLSQQLKAMKATNERCSNRICELKSEKHKSSINDVKLEIVRERLVDLVSESDEYINQLQHRHGIRQKEGELETQLVDLKIELAQHQERADYHGMNVRRIKLENLNLRKKLEYLENLEQGEEEVEEDDDKPQRNPWRSFARHSCPAISLEDKCKSIRASLGEIQSQADTTRPRCRSAPMEWLSKIQSMKKSVNG